MRKHLQYITVLLAIIGALDLFSGFSRNFQSALYQTIFYFTIGLLVLSTILITVLLYKLREVNRLHIEPSIPVETILEENLGNTIEVEVMIESGIEGDELSSIFDFEKQQLTEREAIAYYRSRHKRDHYSTKEIDKLIEKYDNTNKLKLALLNMRKSTDNQKVS